MGNSVVDLSRFPERPLKLATNTDLEWLDSWSRDIYIFKSLWSAIILPTTLPMVSFGTTLAMANKIKNILKKIYEHIAVKISYERDS